MAALFMAATVLGTSARAADPRPNDWNRQRIAASRALALAHEQVQQAQAKASAARTQLNDFLSQYFGDQQSNGIAPAPIAPAPPQAVFKESPSREQQRLEAQAQELQVRRSELLVRLTEAHPEVGDVDRRISVIREQLSAIEQAALANAPATVERGATDPSIRWSQAQRGEASAEFAPLYDAWQAAENELTAALQTESLAAQDLVSLGGVPSEPANPAGLVATPAPAAPALDSPVGGTVPQQAGPIEQHWPVGPANARPAPIALAVDAPQRDSQTAVMAALLIALILAALAAVRLARTSNDQVFFTADEVSAALALPVVGILPRTARRGASAAWNAQRLRRGAVVTLQFLLALAVFALAAYIVQQPGKPWRTVQQPAQHAHHG